MLRLLIFKMPIHAIPVCTFVKNVSLNANVCQQTTADKYTNALYQNNIKSKQGTAANSHPSSMDQNERALPDHTPRSLCIWICELFPRKRCAQWDWLKPAESFCQFKLTSAQELVQSISPNLHFSEVSPAVRGARRLAGGKLRTGQVPVRSAPPGSQRRRRQKDGGVSKPRVAGLETERKK